MPITYAKKDSYALIRIISMQETPEGTIDSSVSCSLFTAIDDLSNDTINLIDFDNRVPKRKVKTHMEEQSPSHFIFNMANPDTCIKIYSYFNLLHLLNKKNKTYIGDIKIIVR